jgi:hypothetical protein
MRFDLAPNRAKRLSTGKQGENSNHVLISPPTGQKGYLHNQLNRDAMSFDLAPNRAKRLCFRSFGFGCGFVLISPPTGQKGYR